MLCGKENSEISKNPLITFAHLWYQVKVEAEYPVRETELEKYGNILVLASYFKEWKYGCMLAMNF